MAPPKPNPKMTNVDALHDLLDASRSKAQNNAVLAEQTQHVLFMAIFSLLKTLEFGSPRACWIWATTMIWLNCMPTLITNLGTATEQTKYNIGNESLRWNGEDQPKSLSEMWLRLDAAMTAYKTTGHLPERPTASAADHQFPITPPFNDMPLARLQIQTFDSRAKPKQAAATITPPKKKRARQSLTPNDDINNNTNNNKNNSTNDNNDTPVEKIARRGD